jgi:MarR family transcriptional regulator, organic hydroperoxide resistance regulator
MGPITATDLAAFTEAYDDFVRAAKRARSRVAADDELTHAQYGLLQHLLEPGHAPGLRELAAAAGVAAPTATRMLDSLERRGVVVRERCTEDRRSVRLSLTPDGERLVRERHASIAATRREIFSRLDEDERAAAAAVLRRLAQALEEVGA